jgi:hypothetical protein
VGCNHRVRAGLVFAVEVDGEIHTERTGGHVEPD